jgi:hypothetical protein
MAKKSVFDESTLDDDLDEYLPRVGVGTRAGQSDPAETPVPDVKVDASAPGGGVGGAGNRSTKAADSDGEGNPTAEISADNLAKLRNLNLAEKRKNPAKARTYGQIVLDAIDAGHEELARHWKPTENTDKAPGSLFTRQPVVRKRRRHVAPPAKIALTGLNPADAKTIDEQLVKEWGAPSRSALVDEALTLYFKRRRGPGRTTKTVEAAAS